MNNMKHASLFLVVLILSMLCGVAPSIGEGLNVQGDNPHRDNPRKRITDDQKRAAWEARKKKMEEIRRIREAERKRTVPFVSVTSASNGQ
ncbi:MAG: hypothetical protein Fur0034_21770 [Desulfuromonadia bacterium]